jgi:hypothetical protein
MRSIVRLLDRLSDLGAEPEDSDDERLRHGTLIFASMVITLISLTWVATYIAYGYLTSAAIPALHQLITVVGFPDRGRRVVRRASAPSGAAPRVSPPRVRSLG